MQTLILANGTEVPMIGCYGDQQYIQGAHREVLDIRLDPAQFDLTQVDELFTAEACGSMTIRESVMVEQQVGTEEVPVLDENGEAVVDEEGNPVVTVAPVMENVEQVSEFLHKGFVLRAALSKQVFQVLGPNGEGIDAMQISVRMAQQSEAEKQMAALTETVDVLVMESLMG